MRMRWRVFMLACGVSLFLAMAGCSDDDDDTSTDFQASVDLSVNFDNGSYAPLVLNYGPTDNPALSDPAYTVTVSGGMAHYQAPERAPGIAFTGMLDLPGTIALGGDMTFQWTFPTAAELRALGNNNPAAWAIAGCYIRGEMNQWVGGLFGDYWFGYYWDAAGAQSVIRQGAANLVSEPFSAANAVSYRIEKNGTTLRQYAKYDNANWHQVGGDVAIQLNAGGTDAVAVTHVRVGDTSGAAINVAADNMLWKW